MERVSRVNVATLQPALRWQRFMPNVHLIRRQVEQLTARRTVDVLVLPESFTATRIEEDDPNIPEQAVQFLSTLARTCGVVVVGGSISRRAEGGAVYNTCHVMDRTGECIGRYDKRRLFGPERDTRTPGTSAGVFEVQGFRLGVLICGDLWHPELSRELVGRVDVLCVPAATVVNAQGNREYARGAWHRLAFVRAMETGAAVVVSDWADGRHEAHRHRDGALSNEVRWTAGASSISDPSRRPELEKMQHTTLRGEAGDLVASIDADRLAEFREYRRRNGLLPEEA